jgi:acyl-CoA reductase-like NAD-dependent aldehyde dehydrogenase
MLQQMLSELTGAGAYRGQMFIDGHWTSGSGRDVFEVENPANERIIGTIPQGTAEDAAAALAAAR